MISNSDDHRDADVIVVGAGGTGLMAALTAAELGLRVVVLEKGSEIGGTTALSFGVFATSGTSYQRAEGIQDHADAHFEDLDYFAGDQIERDNKVLRRLLVDHAPRAFQKLLDVGAVFTQPISEKGHRVPRLHKMLPHSRAVTQRVAHRCHKFGVRFRVSAEVSELIEREGRVAGVRLRDGTELRANRAVLLATGDSSNAPRAFKEKFLPPELVPIAGLNTLSTGDGQRLGLALGGSVRNGDLVWGPEIRFVERPKGTVLSRLPANRLLARTIKWALEHVPMAILRPFMMSFVTSSMRPAPHLFEIGAIFVNREGARFADEQDRPEVHAELQPGGEVFVMFDRALAEKLCQWPNYVSTAPVIDYAYLSDYERHRKDLVTKGETVEAVAKAAGISPAGLAEAVRKANASGEKDIARGPFYVLGPARACIFFGEGGLVVNERLQVTRQDGSAIEGLYAAGSVGQGGLLLNGHGHHVAWAFTSGMCAAESIAEAGTPPTER